MTPRSLPLVVASERSSIEILAFCTNARTHEDTKGMEARGASEEGRGNIRCDGCARSGNRRRERAVILSQKGLPLRGNASAVGKMTEGEDRQGLAARTPS